MALFGILLAQALSGQPVFAPQGMTVVALATWIAALIAGSAFVLAARRDATDGDRLPMMVSR